MAVNLSFIGGAGWQFFTDDGVPLSGGKIFTYAAGTTAPLVTYTSRNGDTPNANPIILDAAGRTPQQIWSTEGLLYKYVVRDANDVLIRTWDYIGGSVVASDLGQDLANTNSDTKGDALIGFRQSDNNGFLTGAAASTVNDKLQDLVSIRDFGAVGDGITDDTIAVQAAMNSQKPLDWGGLTYRITSAVTCNYTTDVYWEGRNATILYNGVHTERAVRLLGGGIDYVVNDLTVDGGKLCNKCLEFDNNTDSYSNATLNNVFVTRAKRLNTFNGGNGLLVRGSFNTLSINGGGASDCELPPGQGTSGTVGIVGIAGSFYSVTRYIKSMYVNGARVNKIYSSDLSYSSDQDGIAYFTPSTSTRRLLGLFSCAASSFENCYGRSIKTQCRQTNVQSSSFTRTEGLLGGIGNNEIDSQSDNGNFQDLSFSYSNGQAPSACVNVSASPSVLAGLLVDGCVAVLDSATTLDVFASTFPSGDFLSRHTVSNNKIYGKVKEFFSFRCNGSKNYAEVSNNYIQEIVDGSTSQKALVYVLSSGSSSPFSANVVAFGNVYDNTHLPALVRDAIPGNSAATTLSAWSNYGFDVNNINAQLTTGGLKTFAAARMGRIAGESGNAYFNVETVPIASGETATISIRNNSRATLVFITVQFNNTAYAFFVNSNTSNTVINKGSAFEFGNTTNPGTGTFRVWTSALNEISIENTNASARTFGVFTMVI